MERRNFIKKQEDFICENCGRKVIGSGYTNHCPYCLWSKHVDNTPGDRLNACGGMMKPTGVELKNGLPVVVIHSCLKCGKTLKNKTSPDDDKDILVDLLNPHD